MPIKIQMITTENAPKAIGPYSQAVLAHPFLFISGQIGIDPKLGKIISQKVEDQTRQVLDNIEAILKEVGLGLDNIVKTEIYLTDMNDFQAVNTIYAERFDLYKPARQTMQVVKLPLDALIEISCIARVTEDTI